ncbi:hypothetical protein BDF14DRAFT_1807873 [Spinellus fusiger]|nr:hypothetical protein BDF14DRAFT_1807873 [Spinellus fusiger]
MARMTYGNTNMPKFCIQGLVRIVANIDAIESKSILIELLDYRIVDLISMCLRGEDVELIYWASGLMHEFVMKDVAADEFRKIKGVHTILASLLSAEEIYISRIVLRTVKFMAYGQEKFRKDIIRSGMVKKIMHCLTLEDDDVRYWAILCLQVVAGQVESHEEIVNAPEFELMLQLAVPRKVHASVFVSDILSLICCIETNADIIQPHVDLIITTLNTLMLWVELEVQFNSAGAIFNIIAMRDEYAEQVLTQCLDTIMSSCSNSPYERVQLICAKILSTLSTKFHRINTLRTKVNVNVLEPLIKSCINIAQMILPIIIMQSLIRAHRRDGSPATPNGCSLSSDNSVMDSEDIFLTDYIDVDASGTITNAFRLEAMLQRPNRPSRHAVESESNGHSLVSTNPLQRPHILSRSSSLESIPYESSTQEGFFYFMNFQIPAASRLRFMGALSALKILLENEALAGQVLKTRLDDARQSSRNPQNIIPVQHTGMLTDTLREHVETLVLMSLYPVLDPWTTQYSTKVDFEKMNESTARDAYQELLSWIRHSVKINPEYRENTTSLNGKVSSNSDPNAPTKSEDEHEGDTSYPTGGPSFRRPCQNIKMYTGFALRALLVLRSLFRYDSIRIYLILEMNIIEVLIYLFENCRLLADHTLSCIGELVNADSATLNIPHSSLQTLIAVFWKRTQFSMAPKGSFLFYARLVLSHGTSIARNEPQRSIGAGFVEIDVDKRTPYCILDYETKLRVRNESWTFETVICTHSTPVLSNTINDDSRFYCYEVVLKTDGLIQIGWVSSEFQFDPQGGTGVGDDDHSYGYDGYREKKWHGKHIKTLGEYGQLWATGDVITCVIDLLLGELRYYRNGNDMGITFTGVDCEKGWYPAASLSTNQEIQFRFGGTLDQLSFLPDKHIPIASLIQAAPCTKLPSPQICALQSISSVSNDYPSDISLLQDFSLKKSLESLTVDVINNGSKEPNLKPVDCSDQWNHSSTAKEKTSPQSLYFDIPEQKATLVSRQPNSSDLEVNRCLYFEVTLTFNTSEDELMDFESSGQGYSGIGEPENLQIIHDYVSIGFKCVTYLDVRLEYCPKNQQAVVHYRDEGKSVPLSLSLKDGDIVGMYYAENPSHIGITFNGKVTYIVGFQKDDDFKPLIPFEIGCLKSYINYGDEPFCWKKANTTSSRGVVYRYLDQLLGN